MTLDLSSLTEYLARARWFGGKGRPFDITEQRRVGSLGDDPRVLVDVLTVTYHDGLGGEEHYQLPLSVYPEPQPELTAALIGVADGQWWYDAVHDPVAMQRFLARFAAEDDGGGFDFTRVDTDWPTITSGPRLFSGEQSNSSVMFGDEAVLKVFRKITAGENPDVSIHEVLTRAGSDKVAALYGFVASADLTLAMLQEFLRGATDGWDVAVECVRTGTDFLDDAALLGAAVAEIHRLLATHFPTRRRSAAELAGLAGTMTRRLEAAAALAPELAAHESALQAIFGAVAHLDGDDIQRIHGDLHLGQTLRTATGWRLVDFEGEPAKPHAERLLPDSPWRDVAGMLRSFDYAPKATAMTAGGLSGDRLPEAIAWSKRHQDAFLRAYAGRELDSTEQTLLAAYVADKAVYEVVYEARNRPAWISVPLAAIAELATTAAPTARSDQGDTHE